MEEVSSAEETVVKKSKVSVSVLQSNYPCFELILSQRRPHVVWMEQYREVYLLEMMRWSGRGDFRTAKHCPDCLARQVEAPGEPRFRCLECALPDLVCNLCCLRRHKLHPFHWVQVSLLSHKADPISCLLSSAFRNGQTVIDSSEGR